MTAADLESVRPQVEVLRWVKQRQAELEALKAKARDAIEATMGDAEEGTLDGKTVIKWSSYKKRALSQKALKKAYPEAFEECVDTTVVRRFELVEED